MSIEHVIRAYIAAQYPYDGNLLGSLRSPEWHADWPQSAERIPSHEADVAVNTNYPGYPTHEARHVAGHGDDVVFMAPFLPGTPGRPVRISGGGDTWFAEVKLTYPDSVWFGVVVCSTLGQRVTEETVWFCPEDRSSGWRSEWARPLADLSAEFKTAHGSPSSVRRHQDSTTAFLRGLGVDVESSVRAFFSDDAIYESPQTLETVTGIDDLISLFTAYPDPPNAMEQHWQVGNFGLFTAIRSLGSQVGWVVAIIEFDGDKACKLSEYWAPRLQAPEWRSQWVMSY